MGDTSPVSFLARLKPKRLSGWARLWIVLIAPVWAISTWSNLAAEHERWLQACDWPGCPNFDWSKTKIRVEGEVYGFVYRPVRPLDETEQEASRRVNLIHQLTMERITRSDQSALASQNVKWIRTLVSVSNGDSFSFEGFLSDQDLKNAARDELFVPKERKHYQRMFFSLISSAALAMLAFALAMLARPAALWVWRGFRAPSGS